jgi:hypothetical protein
MSLVEDNIGGDNRSASDSAEKQNVASVTAIAAGVLASFGATLIFSYVPRLSSLLVSQSELLIRSCTYVLAAALAGAMGSYLCWKLLEPDSSGPRDLIAFSGAAASVWAPSIVLLYRQGSSWMAPVAAISAAALAFRLRTMESSTPEMLDTENDPPELFAKSLLPASRNFSAFVPALCAYGGLFTLYRRAILVASVSFAVCGFAVFWQLRRSNQVAEPSSLQRNHWTSRLIRAALPAVLITFIVLFTWNHNRINLGPAGFADAPQKAPMPSSKKVISDSGFRSIILLSAAETRKFLLPRHPEARQGPDVITEPLVITFDGYYSYFQLPNKAPSPDGIVIRGTPLNANLRSNNSIPLIMQAHQRLSSPLSVGCCGALEVDIESCDRLGGKLYAAVALIDSFSPQKSAINLGDRPIARNSSLFAPECMPAAQALVFAIPRSTSTRKFNEIEVIFILDPSRSNAGARVAIKQFKLVPR